MKQALLLIAVFAVAFAVTLLVSRELFRPAGIRDGVDVPGAGSDGDADLAARRVAAIQSSMVYDPAAAAARELPVDAGASESATTGEIEGTAKTNDGLDPRDPKVTVFPAAPEPVMLGGGRFRIANLAPGSYYVGVSAQGYVFRPPVEVTVAAGRKYSVEIWLERGLELAGMVIDDVDQRPIAGATVDFNGLATVVSDLRGGFRTGVVASGALDQITVSHDEFDRSVIVHPVVPDPQNIVLAMPRGRGILTGRVIAPSGQAATPPFKVRLWQAAMPGHEQLRRENLFKDVTSFEIRGVFPGPSVMEVSFPGTSIATHRVPFDLAREPSVHLDVDLRSGGSIDGTFVHPAGLVASQLLMIVDREGHPMGEARTDASGKFRFEHVAAGEYAIKLETRIPPLQTDFLRVEDGRAATVTVDAQSGRLR